MRTLVYVSGPITQHPVSQEEAVRDAMAAGDILLDAGYAPFIPHLTHFWEVYFNNNRTWNDWMEIDRSVVPRCDALLRLPGKSDGADEEVCIAIDLGIPVFYTIGELLVTIPTQPVPVPAKPSSVPPAIEAAIARIRKTFESKNADYRDDKEAWYGNFADVAHQMQWVDPNEACEALIAVKQARLRSMRGNGRPPQNEGVEDTKLDRAVYSVISLALLIEETL
jgi:hypothetical protein